MAFEGLNGLIVSRKTTKYLVVRRKNWNILTIGRKKKLTVKIFCSHDLSFWNDLSRG